MRCRAPVWPPRIIDADTGIVVACLQSFLHRMQNAFVFALSHLHDYLVWRPMMLALQ